MGVQAIERAFALLRALAVGPAGVTDLAERAELPKSTVARLMAALEQEGAVARDGDGSDYRLGSALADLAGASAPGRNLIAAARPHLIELTERTGETTGISILTSDGVRYLDHVDSNDDVKVRNWTHETVPAHLVPSGLVLLAHVPAATAKPHLKAPLEANTSKSVTEVAKVRKRLVDARQHGSAWGFEEFAEGINSIAAPVQGAEGVEAAIHVHGPAYRFPAQGDSDRIVELTIEAADRLSSHLTQ